MQSKYFKIHELVPVKLYNMVDEEVLWRMIPDELIASLDTLKEKFNKGTMTINSYVWGGDRGWSGLRTKDSKYYSPTSQHTKFKAIDCVFSEYTPDEVRQYILHNKVEFPHIGGLELRVSWVHFDIRDRVDDKIKTFYA